eukprot:contig_1949_g320
MYKGRHRTPNNVLETIWDEDPRVWYLFAGSLESKNDINELSHSPFMVKVTQGDLPPPGLTYTVNGEEMSKPHYLGGGFREWHWGVLVTAVATPTVEGLVAVTATAVATMTAMATMMVTATAVAAAEAKTVKTGAAVVAKTVVVLVVAVASAMVTAATAAMAEARAEVRVVVRVERARKIVAAGVAGLVGLVGLPA